MSSTSAVLDPPAVDVRSSSGRWRPDVALLLILVLAASLRLLYVQLPMAEAHRWRQITNADIARNLAEGPFDVFHPRVNWGGREGYVGMEFPMLHLVAALLFRVLGE